VKYALVTFGCRVNQADSLCLEEALAARGATPAPPESADLVLVNTCSVTATADQAARQAIRRVARTNPAARIVVTGCYATREPDGVSALPNVVAVVPNPSKPSIVDRLPRDLGLTTAERYGSGDGSCGAPFAPGLAGRTAFTLRVQTGCAERCAYCIIPTTRGAPASAAPAAVQREVDRAAAAGFKEIVLTGVHLGSYGRDLTPQTSLAALLERLSRDRPEPLLFRVSSLEPMDCTAEVVDLVASRPALAPHFHLPLQHASDGLLRAMRRPYTIAQYAALVDRIRRCLPAAAIGADLIVGFPGERDADVEQLATYLERSPLTHLHVFPYSDRPGTEASGLGDRVPGGAVRERARRVREIGGRLAARFRASQVGSTRRALTIEDGSVAVTDNYLKVRIAPGRARNEWVQAAVTPAGASGGPETGE
jgi:threonylcarbamoyladenosine tRNA methylthiotransferase MtaB